MKLRKVQHFMKKILKPEEAAKIDKARRQYETAKSAYSGELSKMTENEALYNGSREVKANRTVCRIWFAGNGTGKNRCKI